MESMNNNITKISNYDANIGWYVVWNYVVDNIFVNKHYKNLLINPYDLINTLTSTEYGKDLDDHKDDHKGGQKMDKMDGMPQDDEHYVTK